MNSRCQTRLSRPVSLQPNMQPNMQPDIAMQPHPSKAVPSKAVDSNGSSAAEIARAVASGEVSALSVTDAALARIAKHDPILNSFTDVTADRARARARAVDAAVAAGQDVGALAGVPF